MSIKYFILRPVQLQESLVLSPLQRDHIQLILRFYRIGVVSIVNFFELRSHFLELSLMLVVDLANRSFEVGESLDLLTDLKLELLDILRLRAD